MNGGCSGKKEGLQMFLKVLQTHNVTETDRNRSVIHVLRLLAGPVSPTTAETPPPSRVHVVGTKASLSSYLRAQMWG